MMVNVKRPRVLMIGWELPPHNSGGLGTACAGMAQALVDDGVDIKFTLPYLTDEVPDFLDVINCYDEAWATAFEQDLYNPPFSAYELQASNDNKHQHIHLPSPGSWLENRVEEYAQKVLQYALAHADDFDVIHAHDWMSMPAAIKIREHLDKPFLAHIHSTEYDRSLSEDMSSYIARCELEGMHLADRVLAVSYYTKRLLVEKYAIDPWKIDVVHNGVVKFLRDLSPIKREFAYKRPVVVFMGRLTMQKGPDYFIKLAEAVMKRRPDTLFIVSGMGDMYQQLLLSTASRSLSANVLFSGFVRGGAQQAILRRADVFVMPSVSEPFGLVATEAAILRTPVIASKNSGVVEIISGSPQFDFWDVEAMANEVLHLLEDQNYRERVIADQLDHLEKQTWQKTASDIETVYDKVTTATKKRGRKAGTRRRASSKAVRARKK